MQNILIEKKHSRVWTVHTVAEEKFLRKKVEEFEYPLYEKKDMNALVKHMRKLMVASRGIGLSANQIGLSVRMFIAQLPADDGKGYKGKFYTVVNPRVASASSKKIADEEGCLSIPHTYGTVDRAESIVLEGLDKQGRSVRIKAEGLLARLKANGIDYLFAK